MTPAASSAPSRAGAAQRERAVLAGAAQRESAVLAGAGRQERAVRESRMRVIEPSTRKKRGTPAIRVPARSTARRPAEVVSRSPWQSTAVRTAAIAVAVAGIFMVVVAHVVIDQKQFRIDAMQEQVANAQARQTTLQFRLAQLEAPQKIIASAEALGMVTPSQVTYLVPVAMSPVTPRAAAGVQPSPSSTSTSPSGSARARAPGR